MTNFCSISGCCNPHKARGWCSSHYQRWYYRGTTDDLKVVHIDDHFWSLVDKTDTCWLWMGRKDNGGYGRFKGGRLASIAHRFSYQSRVGPIPEGLTIDHLCRNRACVRPDHLEPVSFTENVLRGYGPTALNKRKTHCKRGHEFNDLNTYHRPDRKNSRACRECTRMLQKNQRDKRRKLL